MKSSGVGAGKPAPNFDYSFHRGKLKNMSTPLPTRDQAIQAQSYMIDQIHVPAFLEKLASYGIQPRNRAEVKQMIQLGAVLAEAEDSGRIKSAQDEENPFLAHLLKNAMPKQASANTDLDTAVAYDAAQLVQTNELAKTAALIYGHVVGGGEIAE